MNLYNKNYITKVLEIYQSNNKSFISIKHRRDKTRTLNPNNNHFIIKMEHLNFIVKKS